MKFLKWMLLGLSIAIAGISNANARDSFSIGLNIGGPGYYAAPPVPYYAPPPVVYRAPPPVVYAPPPVYYRPYEPRIYYRYYDGPRNYYPRGGYPHGGYQHHHGWR